MNCTVLKAKAWIATEPVLTAAAVAAVLATAASWGRVSLQDYADSFDLRTIGLLLALMLVVAGLRDEGVLERAAAALVGRARTMRQFVAALVGLCFFGSMVVTNDVALIVFVPLAFTALTMARDDRLAARVVVLQAVAANMGSSLSPVGNPQNIYLQSHYGLSLAQFFSVMGPLVAVSFACLAALVWTFVPRKAVPQVSLGELPAADVRRVAGWAALFVAVLACVAGAVPWPVMLTAVVVATALVAPHLFARVDWFLLLTFACFFVFVAGLQALPQVDALVKGVVGIDAFAAGAGVSQLISNVPAAVLLPGFTADGAGVLAGVNAGGLGTPIASLASLIALRQYSAHAGGGGMARFMGVFSVVNFGLLAVLCGVHYLLG